MPAKSTKPTPDQLASLMANVTASIDQLDTANQMLKDAQSAVNRAGCNLSNAQNELNKALVASEIIGGDYVLKKRFRGQEVEE